MISPRSSRIDANILFRLFLSIDILLIIIHIANLMYNPRASVDSFFSIETDRGFGESFQYIKELVLIFILIWLTKKELRFAYLSWASFFFYILMDDMLRFHERLGAALVPKLHLTPMLGLRPEDLGELSFLAVFGIIFLVILGLTYILNKNDAKITIFNRKMIRYAFFLIFFGVVTDVFHALFISLTGYLSASASFRIYGFFLFGIIEDGGEMIVLTFTLSYVFYSLFREYSQDTPANR